MTPKTTGPTRELAQRLSGTDEVLLFWNPEIDTLELRVRDVATGTGFQLNVTPEQALDAFHHPYAYAAMLADYRTTSARPCC
jgi:hypothetical protein